MKSIGQINFEAWSEAVKQPVNLTVPGWEQAGRWTRSGAEAGAKAVLLDQLDLMASAGITAADAAKALREGRTIEDLAAERKEAGTLKQKPMYVCAVDCKEGTIVESPGTCKACGGPLVFQPIMSLNLLGNAHRNACNEYIRAKRNATIPGYDKARAQDACTDPDKMHGAADGFGGSDYP